MKKNVTYIFIFLIAFGMTNAFAQEGITAPVAGVDENADVVNNDPVSEWFYDGRSGASFNSPANVDPSTLVPLEPQGSASDNSTPQLSVAGISQWFMKILSYAVQLILVLALVSFLYGIFRLVFLDATNEEARNKARKFMLWGVIALFVMVSVWGLVNVLRSSFFGSGAGLTLPGFK